MVMTPNAIRWVMGMAVTAALAAAVACGGSDSPTAPSDSGGGSSGGGTVSDMATITISSAGVVSPSTVTIRQGGRVTFVNSDNRTHEMNSNPHPNHGDCPAIDDVGFLSPGQSKQTGNLTVVRTCGYHDHNQPDVASLQGQIIVQ